VSGRQVLRVVAGLALLVAVACGGESGEGAGDDAARAGTSTPAAGEPGRTATTTTGEANTTTPSTAPASPPPTRPDWLGTRVLSPGGPHPTPPELDPRRLPTVDVLPPPDGGFHATIEPVPPEVAARSTWQPDCPVALEDLRYVTVTFWGFDDRPHTGEMLVHRDAAEPLSGVFRRLYEMRFPIEDMRVTSVEELNAPDTGDGNATAAFVCRPTRGSSSWSEHAYGLAVDVNPFQNPYVHDGRVTPGLATSYTDRANVRPGMIVPGAGVVEAFAEIGWGWGGTWDDPKDYMHFSAAGR
jgi:hypothetical protein